MMDDKGGLTFLDVLEVIHEGFEERKRQKEQMEKEEAKKKEDGVYAPDYRIERLEVLVGERLVGIDVSPNQHALRLRIQDGRQIVCTTYADCCSETWFADILGAKSSLGKVTKVEPRFSKAIEGDGRSRQEYDVEYGFKIKTLRGDIDVAYRNSSNGYYGGSLDQVFVEPASDDGDWTPIADDDWSA
jgi:hypothetical protein